jgi:hypothetical protein
MQIGIFADIVVAKLRISFRHDLTPRSRFKRQGADIVPQHGMSRSYLATMIIPKSGRSMPGDVRECQESAIS